MKLLKKGDIVICCLSAAICAVSIISILNHPNEEPVLIIESPQETWIYQLDENRHIHAPGPLGDTIVAVRDKKAYIEDSPCPNKTCTLAHPIQSHGQWTACLPNRIIIRIENIGRKDISGESIDAVAF